MCLQIGPELTKGLGFLTSIQNFTGKAEATTPLLGLMAGSNMEGHLVSNFQSF